MRMTEDEYGNLMKKRQVSTPTPVQNSSKKLVLPYPPSANVMWRTTKRGITYLSEEAKAYKLKVAELAEKQNIKRIDGDVILHIQ